MQLNSLKKNSSPSSWPRKRKIERILYWKCWGVRKKNKKKNRKKKKTLLVCSAMPYTCTCTLNIQKSQDPWGSGLE
jgi:hypothetical protein